jgi:hypothetical protein
MKFYIKILYFLIFCALIYCVNLQIKFKNKHKTKHKKQNKNYIFAYGSLLNYYVQKILIKNNKFWPKATLKKEFGYERYWLHNDNYGLTLGIEQSKTPNDINGILIEISDDELKNFDKYEIEESNHSRLKIDWNDIKCDSKFVNKNYNIYVYVIKEKTSRGSIVKKMPNLYALTVMSGFRRYGNDYLDQFIKSTK